MTFGRISLPSFETYHETLGQRENKSRKMLSKCKVSHSLETTAIIIKVKENLIDECKSYIKVLFDPYHVRNKVKSVELSTSEKENIGSYRSKILS